MDVQPYVTLLQASAPSLQQVVVAQPGVTAINVSTAAELKTVLDAPLANQVFNLVLPQHAEYPNLAFQMVASNPQVVDGYHLYQVETYHLFIRDKNLMTLISTVDAVKSAIESSVFSIEVQDEMYDYDDVLEAYRVSLEVTFTVIAMATQTLPAAIVYPVGVNADPSSLANKVRQHEIESFAIVLMSNATNMTPLRREVQAALLGKQVSNEYDPINYRQGTALDGGGGLSLWQEIYTDGLHIAEV